MPPITDMITNFRTEAFVSRKTSWKKDIEVLPPGYVFKRIARQASKACVLDNMNASLRSATPFDVF